MPTVMHPSPFSPYRPPATAGFAPSQKPSGPETTEPTYPTFRATGFFHLDAARFAQDEVSRTTLGDIPDGVAFRRARLAGTGNLTEDITYMMEFDFSNTQPDFVDVWVDFARVPYLGHLRIGRWRQPFGMAALTGIRDLPFLERPLPFALSPFRQTGIGFYNHADDLTATWAFSGYRYLTDFFGNTVGDNGGYGLTGRATFLPVDNGEDTLIHLGGSYTFNDPARDILQFFSPPEVFVAQNLVPFQPTPIDGTPFFVSTGDLPANYYHGFNLEAAWGSGPFAVQTEARWAVVKQLGGGTVTLPSCYVDVRYVLTGETIPYDRKTGVFTGVRPNHPFTFNGCGGPGAWELAARYSYIDLDGTIGTGPGRSLDSLTFGVNWYLNPYVKFQFNYIRAMLHDRVLGRSDTDIFALRTQVSF